MKTERKILLAFLLNLVFCLFEILGGIVTGSVAILTDALHDAGDTVSIGLSLIFERISNREADENYTYGYKGYSVIGATITTLVLLFGCIAVIYGCIHRIINPVTIDYNAMILFAIVGTAVNLIAVILTARGDSENQKAVNLHMLEDVLGWAAVLIGAVVMRFTDLALLDPIISLCVAVYIMIHTLEHLVKIFKKFLYKMPEDTSVSKVRESLIQIAEIKEVYHIHIQNINGRNFATMHIVSNRFDAEFKKKIRDILYKMNIHHVTLEFETENEKALNECYIEKIE